jgi:hypothetical protein
VKGGVVVPKRSSNSNSTPVGEQDVSNELEAGTPSSRERPFRVVFLDYDPKLAAEKQMLPPPGLVAALQPLEDHLERIAQALSIPAAARFIGVGEGALEQLIRTRKIAFVRLGSQRGRVITIESLRAFLREHRQPTGEEMMKKRRRQ